MIRIATTSIFVNDQQKALEFYTHILGFSIKDDIPIGEFRWITIVSEGNEQGIELLLEPNNHPAAKMYQESIFRDRIPATMFDVDNLDKEYKRLCDAGVAFTMKPTSMEGFSMAVFDDTCGNLIQLIQRLNENT